MRHAVNLKDVELGMLLPGIRLKHLAERFRTGQAMAVDALRRTNWHLFGDVMSGGAKN